MAAAELIEEIQSVRGRLNQLPSIKDNEQLVVTTSTIVGKIRGVSDALPHGDVLHKLVLQLKPSLVEIVSVAKEIAEGSEENRWKLDETTRRLSANLTDVESVLLEDVGDVHGDNRSAEEKLTHYRFKLEERRERMGQSVEGEKLESTLESSREEFSTSVADLGNVLSHSSPSRDDVLRPAAVMAKAVCSLLDVADTYFQTPSASRSEVHGHTMSVIRIAKNYVLDVEEMKSAVSRLNVAVKSMREECQNQMSKTTIQIEVEYWKQDDASNSDDQCMTDRNEAALRQSPIISTAKALYDFDMEDKEENLQFFKGDIIHITKKNESGWWEGRVGTKTGVFPATFVQVLGDQPLHSSHQSVAPTPSSGSIESLRSGLPPSSSDNQQVLERRSSAGGRNLKVQHQGLQSASDSQIGDQIPAYATSRRVYTWGGEDESQLTQPVHKEGIMKKEGGHHKSWKTRWFILDQDKILYYRPTQLKSPMGSIDLQDYKFAAVTGDRPGHQNCFNLVSSGEKRTYYFSTSSREEMNDWIFHINCAIKKRKKSGQISVESAHAEFEGSVGKVAAAECIEYLLAEDRIRHDGLFRLNGNVGQVKRYLEAVDRGTVPPVDEIHNPLTVASILKHLIKEKKVKVLVVAAVAKELYQEVERKCAPTYARSLLFGIHGFRLLGGLIRLFSEVLAVQKPVKSKVTVDDLARALGVYVFEDLSVAEAVVVLRYLLSMQSEVFG